MLRDLIGYAISNIAHRQLRSWLMVTSILVGIAAIFALVSFGQGLQTYIEDLGAEMGSDKLVVMPKTLGPPGIGSITFDDDDVDFLRRINGVAEAAPMSMTTVQITYKRDDRPRIAYMAGLPTGEERRMVEQLLGLDLEAGRAVREGDRLKATIGHLYAVEDRVFDQTVRTGSKLTINDVDVEVIGIYESIGNPIDDQNIYMTLDGYEELLGVEQEYAEIILRAEGGVDPSNLAERIKVQLRRERGLEEGNEDFTVQTLEDLMESFNSIIDGVNGVLVLIALVSLAVAGVNIMNTMYTAILERTQEIGVMKAIGAQNKDILTIFLIESGILGLAGGVLGVLLGYGIAKTGGIIATAYGYSFLQPIFPVWLTLVCLLFSLGIGAIAGILPSRQASQLPAAEALRYE